MTNYADICHQLTKIEETIRAAGAPTHIVRQLSNVIADLQAYDGCPNDKPDDFMAQINAIIDSNLSNPDFSVDMVVGMVAMSRSLFYRRFKETCGISVGNYINERRIAKAKYMLANHNMHINEISYAIGYANQRYFATFFKKQTGMTPTQWRLTQTQQTHQPCSQPA